MTSETKLWLNLWLSRLSHKLEIRPISPVTGKPAIDFYGNTDAEKIASYIDRNADNNVFFGVLGRAGQSGGKESIREAHCLWADIDFKELQGGQEEADGIVATFDHKPTLQVASGGGYHLYWFLEEFTADLTRVERILKGLVPRLKSDPKVAQAAAVLRPVGTMNWKYDPPREVKAVSLEMDRIYTLEDFKEWELPEEQKTIDLGIESEERLDVRRYLKQYKIPVVKVKPHGTATLFCLKLCLFDENHAEKGKENEAAIGQTETGTLYYQCFHASCVDRKWAEVREKISGKDPLTPFILRDLRPLIEKYVDQLTGETSIGSLLSWFDVKTITERQKTMAILSDMAAKRDIVWTGRKHGVFRPVDKNPHIMRLGLKRPEALGLELPFELDTIVKLYAKNVILVAGEKNAGKTAFAMNTAYSNRDRIPVRYLNSEMGQDELEDRLRLFPDKRMTEWSKITWIEQSSKFEDAVDPDGLNIIDFLEIGADAYEVVDDIRRVFDRLERGLLLIVMQKRSYKEFAVGGEATLEKARLAINLEHRGGGVNVCKITVAKNWTGKIISPRGYECEYLIWSGGKMEMTKKGWYLPKETKKETRNLKIVGQSAEPDGDINIHEE